MAQGFVLWFTGLSGAGKSTLASLVSGRLRALGVHVECLDGDEVRKHLSWGLGFSREDRDRNVRRLGYVARMVARSGACAVTAAISPYRSVRDEVRSQTERFCEVYCDCPIGVLSERDPKGLYKRALAGELKNFTGVDDPYEEPTSPEVHLYTDRQSAAECVEIILARLDELGFLDGVDRSSSDLLALPYGGDLFDAPVRPLSEGAPLASRIEVGETEAALTAAIAAGWLSPVSGFMTRREAEKVRTGAHLEQGLPWPVPIVLPLLEGEPLPASGDEVALACGGRDVGRLHVQQVHEDASGRPLLAGVIESVAEESAVGASARAIRAEARRRSWSRFVAWFDRGEAATDLARGLRLVSCATDGVVLFVGKGRLAAAGLELGALPDLILVELPWAADDARFAGLDAVIARNVGAHRVVSLDGFEKAPVRFQNPS